jgi:hypothetical protein
MGTYEQDEGTQIELDSGSLAAGAGWTLLSGTVNRIGPEVMLHIEFAHGAGAPALALQLPDSNFWPDDDVHTEDGNFVIKAGAQNAVHHINTTGVPTGGSSAVTYAGKAPITVNWNESAAGLQALLDGIFGAGNTLVSGGALPTQLVVTFQGALAGTPIAAPTVVDSLSGGSTPHLTSVVATVGEAGGGIDYLGDTTGAAAGPIVCEAVFDPWNGH